VKRGSDGGTMTCPELIYWRLKGAEGRFVPLAELAAALGYGMHGRPSIDEATANIVRQHVARLRRQLAPFGRESVVMRYRRGYALVREDVP